MVGGILFSVPRPCLGIFRPRSSGYPPPPVSAPRPLAWVAIPHGPIPGSESVVELLTCVFGGWWYPDELYPRRDQDGFPVTFGGGGDDDWIEQPFDRLKAWKHSASKPFLTPASTSAGLYLGESSLDLCVLLSHYLATSVDLLLFLFRSCQNMAPLSVLHLAFLQNIFFSDFSA